MKFYEELIKTNLLTSDRLILNQPQLIKLMVVDVIGNASIQKVEIAIIERSGRNEAVEHLPFTEMENLSPYYTLQLTPTFTPTTDTLILKVRKIDSDNNYEVIDEITVKVESWDFLEEKNTQ